MSLQNPGPIRSLFKLMRFQATGAVWIVLVVGALAQGGRDVSWLHMLKLFLVAAPTYVLAIVMNEYYDVGFDRGNKELSTKPLVSGAVSMRTAAVVFWVAGLMAFFFTYLFWGIFPALVYGVSVMAGSQYNFWGKRHYWMDIWVAIWAAMFCWFGALTMAPDNPQAITPLVYVLSAMWFFRLVVGNSVEGGIKDLESDIAGKAKTLPVWFGVKLEKNGRIRYTPGWWLFELGLEIGFAAAIIAPMYLGIVQYTQLQIVLITIFLAGMAITLAHISPRYFRREDIKKHTFLHEAMGFGIMGIMLVETAGWERSALILVVPLLWFAIWVRLIYGSRLPTI
ncbi:MAG: UbiA family prenyltransferase [Candidatus Thermoplasmatota archaeon]|nr:UbiA family prenyltransferase [Candidatus Thermoplasmatota archaeon]